MLMASALLALVGSLYGAAESSEVSGSVWFNEGTESPSLCMKFLPDGTLLFEGGYLFYNPSHWARSAGDPDLVDMLAARSREIGIEIVNQTELIAIEKTADGFDVAARRNGEKRQWSVDLVVHGAGRIPAIDNLELEAAGVEYGAKGVAVSEHLQSVSNENVYAAGDAAATPGAPLTPVAIFEGKVAASNMLKGNKATPDYRGVPSAVFTIPELVRVGMLESEAKEAGRDVRVVFTDTNKWYSNFRIGETCAAAKVLIDKETDELIGAHMIGPDYGELINYFGLAMRLGLETRDLKQMVSAYPSVSSDLGSML